MPIIIKLAYRWNYSLLISMQGFKIKLFPQGITLNFRIQIFTKELTKDLARTLLLLLNSIQGNYKCGNTLPHTPSNQYLGFYFCDLFSAFICLLNRE